MSLKELSLVKILWHF